MAALPGIMILLSRTSTAVTEPRCQRRAWPAVAHCHSTQAAWVLLPFSDSSEPASHVTRDWTESLARSMRRGRGAASVPVSESSVS